MSAHPVHQVLRDLTSVCQRTSLAASARWAGTLVMRLPECTKNRSLRPADQSWELTGASFRTATGAVVALPGAYTAGAREMYCRNVYLRTGLVMPSAGWVLDLGANRGLFSVWAALSGARSIAVEAQCGFAEKIHRLALHNGVDERVHVEIATASGVNMSGSEVGRLADDQAWSQSSDGGATRPMERSVPELMAAYGIDRVGLLKMDIEGGEFAVLAARENLAWLHQVDQLAIELHGSHGDVPGIIGRLCGAGLAVDLRDDFGRRVAATSSSVAYAYCRRTEAGQQVDH